MYDQQAITEAISRGYQWSRPEIAIAVEGFAVVFDRDPIADGHQSDHLCALVHYRLDEYGTLYGKDVVVDIVDLEDVPMTVDRLRGPHQHLVALSLGGWAVDERAVRVPNSDEIRLLSPVVDRLRLLNGGVTSSARAERRRARRRVDEWERALVTVEARPTEVSGVLTTVRERREEFDDDLVTAVIDRLAPPMTGDDWKESVIAQAMLARADGLPLGQAIRTAMRDGGPPRRRDLGDMLRARRP